MITIKWGMLANLHEYEVVANKFKSILAEITNGQVDVEIVKFENEPSNPLTDIESGTIDLFQVTSTQLKWLTKKDWLDCWNVPFLFENKEHVEAYITSNHAAQKLSELETDKLLPITYSYAGGFTSILRKKDDSNLGNLLNQAKYRLSYYNLGQMCGQEFAKMYMDLPFTILMYEVHEIANLQKQYKDLLSFEMTTHHVLSRVSMLSKKKMHEIPVEYRGKVLSALKVLLDDERQTIYDKSERGIESLRNGDVDIVDWSTQQKLTVLSDAANQMRSEEAKTEVDFILGLKA